MKITRALVDIDLVISVAYLCIAIGAEAPVSMQAGFAILTILSIVLKAAFEKEMKSNPTGK